MAADPDQRAVGNTAALWATGRRMPARRVLVKNRLEAGFLLFVDGMGIRKNRIAKFVRTLRPGIQFQIKYSDLFQFTDFQ